VNFNDLVQKLGEKFGDLVSAPTEFRGELTMNVTDAEQIAEVCKFAKQDLRFNLLLDVSSVDNYGQDPRWTIVFVLYGIAHGQHLRLKTNVGEEKSELPTLTSVWRTADWHERDIYDMMGIRFRGHPDLRRILMWDGYPYFPLRKDFPLAGKPSELPGVAFSKPAPMEGGPFVTVSGGNDSIAREPRVRIPGTDSVEFNNRVEARSDNKETRGRAYGPGPIEPKP
jgi:NADH-quinone oxidoreductase subunit C